MINKQNKLLFDLWKAQPNSESKFHGGGEYMKSLLQSFLLVYGTTANIDVFFDTNLFMDEWVYELLCEYNIGIKHVSKNEELADLLTLGEYDCMYSGLPLDYDRKVVPKSVHFIGTVHGIRFAETPTDKYEYKFYSGLRRFKHFINYYRTDSLREKYSDYYENLKDLDEVICDSRHSKYATCALLGFPLSSIKLAYCPPQRIESPEKPIQLINKIGNKKIILMVSCGRWIKNAYRAFKALDWLFSKGMLEDYLVVCCGLNKSLLFQELNNRSRFISLGYVSSSHLQYLYSTCSIFLYPTLNEGFGFPPLEVLRYGNTCVLSSVCSLPELYGDAVYYVNPYSEQEIASRIMEAADNPIPSETCIAKHIELNKKQTEGETALIDMLFEWAS